MVSLDRCDRLTTQAEKDRIDSGACINVTRVTDELTATETTASSASPRTAGISLPRHASNNSSAESRGMAITTELGLSETEVRLALDATRRF